MFLALLSFLEEPKQKGNNDNTMNKIYFFQRKSTEGQPFGEIIDVDERTAFDYYRIPRNFFYIGCSDGRFINEAKKQVIIKKDRGINADIPEVKKKLIRGAIEKEIEFARQHKIIPPDHTKMNLDGGQMDGDIQRFMKI